MQIKILHVGKFYPVMGGIEKVMYDIVTGMSKCTDCCCDMLCASTDCRKHVFYINGAKIISTATWIKVFATMISPSMIWQLRRICRNYHIIHVHHPDPMAALALKLSGYKGKVVLHWHSDILKQKLMLKFYFPLQNWLIKRADVIVGTTPKYLDYSPFLQDESLHKICIPIGIDSIKYDQEKVNQLKEKYKNKKIVFSLGRLVEYKGYEYLIRAACLLSDDYVVLIGGSGPLKSHLETLILALGLQNRVELLGRISDEDLPTYYGACDIYALSSIWKTEAFGIVQIEAMSYGKPIIATKIEGSGVDWVNENEVSGINVNPMDSNAIANAIKYILSDKKQYQRLSEGARKRYETCFKKEIMIERCVQLYRSLGV